jgi:hypothetical protein
LLRDGEAQVRFHAAAALLRDADKTAMPALIALLEDSPANLPWRVERLLCAAIAGRSAPCALLGDDLGQRGECRLAWQRWWKANSPKVELAKVPPEDPFWGVTVLASRDDNPRRAPGAKRYRGQVRAYARHGGILWEINEVDIPYHFDLLPGGHVLVAEHGARQVTEWDRQGKVLWQHALPAEHNPIRCQRLPSGNTFILAGNEMREVTPGGKLAWSLRGKLGGPILSARKLGSGNIITLSVKGLTELDSKGKEARHIPLEGIRGGGSVEPLCNGNYLVALYNANRVVEVDASGRVVWERACKGPLSATRLRNGNVLVSCSERNPVVEYDRAGKEVWRPPFRFAVRHAGRY